MISPTGTPTVIYIVYFLLLVYRIKSYVLSLAMLCLLMQFYNYKTEIPLLH